MSWNITPNPTDGLIGIIYKDKTDYNGIVSSSKLALDEGRKLKFKRFLVDCTYAEFTVKRSELFELPSTIYKEWNVDPSYKSALIKPKKMKVRLLLEFYILATRSLGWNAKMFDDKDQATKWLIED